MRYALASPTPSMPSPRPAVLSSRASANATAGDGPVEMLRGVRAGQGLRRQGPHPDDQPTQSRARGGRPRGARGDPAVREALSGLSNPMLIRRSAQLETTTAHDVTSAAVYTLRPWLDASLS